MSRNFYSDAGNRYSNANAYKNAPSHGFAINWSDRTGVVPPKDIDVIMVAPKCTVLAAPAESRRSRMEESAGSNPIANYPYSGLTIYFDVTKGGWTFRNSLYNGAGYNGWKAHDNPFLVRPKKDGIFNMSQLEYEHKGGKYFAGAAVHTRQYPINEDGEMVSADESKGKTTCGWWIYGEQSVWKAGDKNISCMVQYSENTSHQNACYRYAELGGAYQDEKNECGLSGQYARFQQGSEYSLEVTWKRQLTESISLQPSFQYIKNDNGDFTALSARLYVSF